MPTSKLSQSLLCIIAFMGVMAHESSMAQQTKPSWHFTISAPRAAEHIFNVKLESDNWNEDSLLLKMPRWAPGYYQLMNFPATVDHMKASSSTESDIPVRKVNENTWLLSGITKKGFTLSYEVKSDRQFVGNPYVDSAHAYIVPPGVLLYPIGALKTSVTVALDFNKQWTAATGLQPIGGTENVFIAPDFDVLYDSPILAGPLEELPSFTINGIEHRFIGYRMGSFDHREFMVNLEKIASTATALIGDIPYPRYTFIGTGPGRGGIEHSNSTTVGFDESRLRSPSGMQRTMNFLAHEFFHLYNVKRIRPFELGPFDYEIENRTNLLWVSEGLTVYYEYMIVYRAGLSTERELFANFEANINSIENSSGRKFQSLQQASYGTWSDGPEGKQASDTNKTISYYEKGPLVGLLLDLAIRHASKNSRSLDDVMRSLYWKYYKDRQRGFTDAEFEEECEAEAGAPLTDIFEYVYTTKELDYNRYLQFAGLNLDVAGASGSGTGKTFTILRRDDMTDAQSQILNSWLGRK